ncbi:MAG: SAM-dependent methyltransferase [Opitutaceae bacterium]|nr:SAM-dependent methyltransferase [Opitutaceae bacterium]
MNPAAPLESFLAHVAAALRDGTFVRLLLSQPLAGATPCERVIGRLVQVRGAPALSLTLREPRRDTTQNLGLDAVAGWLGAQLPAVFRSAVLETTAKTWQLHAAKDGSLKLAAHRPTQTAAPSRQHDRAKSRFLDAAALPWLVQLGLCTPDGAVRASMADKHRQLERYLEIVSHLAADCGWRAGDAVTVADMGCGKGYLTFGVWHLLTKHLGLRATVLGVEARADLVEKTSAVARAIGADGLSFTVGTIADAALPPVDVLIALHACNTATDDALSRGVRAGARLVLLSPCCHQELRPQLGRPEPLAPILAHGIMAERFSEWLTDGLRALHLERAGYTTKVVEFVSSEHTPRNLLLAGVRRATPPDVAVRAQAAGEIQRLKAWAGVGHHALDRLLLD